MLIGAAATAANEVVREVVELVADLPDPVPVEFAREFQAGTIHHPVPQPFFDRIVAESVKAPARVWRDVVTGLLAYDDLSRLASIAVPTLVLGGEQDALFSPAEQAAVASAIPRARLSLYPDTGHCPNWERPGAGGRRHRRLHPRDLTRRLYRLGTLEPTLHVMATLTHHGTYPLSGRAVSEYQYYEFLAIDRPLDDDEQAEVRSLSTRARITATNFVNEYHWGNFKGDPNLLVERYYDAHLHVANWGTHRVMFRLPSDLLDPEVVEDYCVDDQLSAWVTDEFIVLDFTSEDHGGEFDFDYDAEAKLAAIVGVRAELAAGDFRPLYLAWLAAYGAWERDEDAFDRDADDDLEPPVPPGLGTLTAAQQALVDFLRLDDDLLAIAAQTSPPLEEITDDPGDLAAWVTRLPVAEKNRLLARVVQGEAARVRMELLRGFRGDTAPTIPVPTRRTVADLLDAAARQRVRL